MRVLVRADSSREIGTGHVVRCLTLAQALRSRSAHVEFMSSTGEGNINSQIVKAGFAVSEIQPEAGHWDWLIVDHYGLDHVYERSARTASERILVIDDLANRVHDCDLLLDQNLYPQMELRYAKLIPQGAVTLLGPTFALLRPEFAEARAAKPRVESVSRILVFFGGSDPTDETSKALEALAGLQLGECSIDVLVGAANPRREKLESMVRRIPRCSLVEPTEKMAALMSTASLVVGAGGTTSWERCCLGLPSIVVAVADNQIAISRALADGGYQEYLGSHESVSVEVLRDALRVAIADFSSLAAAGARSRELVDGLGVQRVLEAMGVR